MFLFGGSASDFRIEGPKVFSIIITTIKSFPRDSRSMQNNLQATETKSSNRFKVNIFSIYISYYLAYINWQKSFYSLHL